MNNDLIAVEVNLENGKILKRELTNDEIIARDAILSDEKIKLEQTQAKIAARENALAKLADLGLTAEEIAAL